MKTLWIMIPFLALASLWAADQNLSDPEMDAFRKQVETVLEKRGVSYVPVEGSPFVRPLREAQEGETAVVEPPVQQEETPLFQRVPELKAIMGKSALLDQEWCRAGDRLEGYEVIRVGEATVLLRNEDGEKILRIGADGTAIRLERVGR